MTEREDLKGDYQNTSSGPFSAHVDGLSANTTYYYQAYVYEWDAANNKYEFRTGEVKSFKTPAEGQTSSLGYLECYEVPAISNLNGNGEKGYKSERDDHWYRYYTTNSKRQVATHTFTHPYLKKQVRNYTVMYDGNKYAPIWTAYAIHSVNWGALNSGLSSSWMSDPAISLTQQTGLDNANSVGFSRGHMVSSQERQTSAGQNAQTYYYTNQAPQWQNSFNNGVWSAMEKKIVDNAPSGRDTLYVVTGVLYEDSTTLPSGSLDVPIPSHFYKCLMLCSFNESGTMTAAKGIAYLFTNEAHSNANYYDDEFVKTIDEVEALAGFDFFAKVPSSLQNTAESKKTPLWTF